MIGACVNLKDVLSFGKLGSNLCRLGLCLWKTVIWGCLSHVDCFILCFLNFLVQT